MKSILLIGLGRFGEQIAEMLYKMNKDVLAIDKNEANVNQILEFATDAKIGDSTNENFMKSLGVSNFDVCIVAIGSDFQSSLETTSMLKEYGAKKVVARASTDRQAKLLLKIGADEIVYPEKQLGTWTAIRYSSDNMFDYIELDHEYSICEVAVPHEIVGKTVQQSNLRQKYGINILAFKQDGVMNPMVAPDNVFTEQTRLLVLGRYKDIARCFKL